jgi:hypothetical protein
MNQNALVNKIDWAKTVKRYVAYFDIMGFKDMVLRSTHDEIYEMMKNIDQQLKQNISIDWGGKENLNLVNVTMYSDSIIIYSKDDSVASLDAIVCTVSSLTSDLLIEAIPHKGALAFGTMTIDMENSIFFGQPLIDAFLLQEELNYYGTVVHATAEEGIVNAREKGATVVFLEYYPCYFKKGNSRHLTIYPMSLISREKYPEEYDRLFASLGKLRLKTSGHLRNYIDNTETYLNTISAKFHKKSDKHRS